MRNTFKKSSHPPFPCSGFFARLAKPKSLHRSPSKEPSAHVDLSSDSLPNHPNTATLESCLDWLLSSDDHVLDWVQVLEFSDRLSASPSDGSLCVKIIQKFIKRADLGPYLARLIRLTALLALNSSDAVRREIAAKKFLRLVEYTYNKAIYKLSSSQAHKPAHSGAFLVKDTIQRAFSVLGFEFQNHPDLNAFTHFYNRIKPLEAPLNGLPLAESDPLFTPASKTARLDNPPASANPSPAPGDPSGPYPSQVLVPPARPVRLASDVQAEAEIARNNARVLIEALAFTIPEEVHSNEIIKEFYNKCLQHQSQLIGDIPWATSQVERARLKFVEAGGGVQRLPHEDLLDTLLSVNSELLDAFRQYEEMEKVVRANGQVEKASEQSRVPANNMKGPGRYGLLDGSVPPTASSSHCSSTSSCVGSRSASPVRGSTMPLPEDPRLRNATAGGAERASATRGQHPRGYKVDDVWQDTSTSQRFQNYPASPIQHSAPGSKVSSPSGSDHNDQFLGHPRYPHSQTQQHQGYHHSSSHQPQVHTNTVRDEDCEEVDDGAQKKDRDLEEGLSLATPTRPSEKALGKMRRISGRF